MDPIWARPSRARTAPSTATYNLSATFTTIQTGNTPPTAYVYLGNTQVYSQQLQDPSNNQFGTPATFTDNNVLISQGTTVDFVVWGANGNNKTTEVQATIATPEPASLAIWGGVIASGLLVARRRKA